jgi:hypothetical protein
VARRTPAVTPRCPRHDRIDRTKGGTSRTQPTTREARTQLVVTVIAIAVGGIVFALVGDFVIGLAVGAAVFALARQAIKVWGNKNDHQADTASKPDHQPVHR